MPVVQANGLDIHYQIDGAGPETLVLINGVGDDLEGWGFQRDDFAAAGLRVVTFDNRGCGSSSHPPGRTPASRWRPTPRAWSTRSGWRRCTCAGSPD
jgi:pimeloyl-ACP methyl ester carboxylesterase